jgi:hypothetical protein
MNLLAHDLTGIACEMRAGFTAKASAWDALLTIGEAMKKMESSLRDHAVATITLTYDWPADSMGRARRAWQVEVSIDGEPMKEEEEVE